MASIPAHSAGFGREPGDDGEHQLNEVIAAYLEDLQAGRLPEAEDQFMRALKRAPANGWSYFGLLALYQARGDTAAAAKAQADLARTWVGDRGLLQISNL